MLDGELIDYAANVYDWGSVLPADYDSIAPTAAQPAASNKRAAKPPSGQRANKQGRALPPPGSAFTGHTPIGLTLPTAVAYEIPPQQRMYAAPMDRGAWNRGQYSIDRVLCVCVCVCVCVAALTRSTAGR